MILYIDTGRFGITYFNEFAGFEYPQQFALKIDVHFADLIQEEGAVVGFFDQSFFIFDGTGKGAGAVTEQFAFQQLFTESTTVQSNEGLAGTLAACMYGLRKHFLTRTRFAQ